MTTQTIDVVKKQVTETIEQVDKQVSKTIQQVDKAIHTKDQTLVSASIAISTAIVLGFIINFLLSKLVVKYIANRKHDHPTLDKAIVKSISKPLATGIYLYSIMVSSIVFCNAIKFRDPIPYVKQALPLSFVLLITWFGLRFTNSYERYYLSHQKRKKANIDKTLVHAISQLSKASIFITAALIILDFFNVDIRNTYLWGYWGYCSCCFCSRLISQLLCSIVIYLDRPFQIGDWIRSSDRNIEGTVVSIGWRVTIVRTFDKRPLYIPNATFANIIVENPSRMSNRRIREMIGIRYEDIPNAREILSQIREMLASHKDIDQKQSQMVF